MVLFFVGSCGRRWPSVSQCRYNWFEELNRPFAGFSSNRQQVTLKWSGNTHAFIVAALRLRAFPSLWWIRLAVDHTPAFWLSHQRRDRSVVCGFREFQGMCARPGEAWPSTGFVVYCHNSFCTFIITFTVGLARANSSRLSASGHARELSQLHCNSRRLPFCY